MGFFEWLDAHPGWGFVYLAIIMLCLLGMVSAIASAGRKRTVSVKGMKDAKEAMKALKEMQDDD